MPCILFQFFFCWRCYASQCASQGTVQHTPRWGPPRGDPWGRSCEKKTRQEKRREEERDRGRAKPSPFPAFLFFKINMSKLQAPCNSAPFSDSQISALLNFTHLQTSKPFSLETWRASGPRSIQHFDYFLLPGPFDLSHVDMLNPPPYVSPALLAPESLPPHSL